MIPGSAMIQDHHLRGLEDSYGWAPASGIPSCPVAIQSEARPTFTCVA